MMAPGPSPDPLALAAAAGCRAARDRHRLDCLVRYLLPAADGGSAAHRSPAELPAAQVAWSRAVALGLDPASAELVVEAGIGSLRLTPAVVDWRPVQPRSAPPSPPPLPAPEALRVARLAACQGCSRWNATRCTLAGCGCSGLGNASALLSRCPLGSWPPSPVGEAAAPTR